jgi:hypothetical protein
MFFECSYTIFFLSFWGVESRERWLARIGRAVAGTRNHTYSSTHHLRDPLLSSPVQTMTTRRIAYTHPRFWKPSGWVSLICPPPTLTSIYPRLNGLISAHTHLIHDVRISSSLLLQFYISVVSFVYNLPTLTLTYTHVSGSQEA